MRADECALKNSESAAIGAVCLDSSGARMLDVVGRTSLRSMPPAMFTMKNELHGLLFSCMHLILFVLCFVALPIVIAWPIWR